MKIYISGPMRKHPQFNFPAFLQAAEALRYDYPDAELFSPAQKDIDAGFQWQVTTGHEDLKYDLGFDLRESLAMDMEWIAREATHIYMLRGWAQSSGARAEKALAEALGLTVLFENGSAQLEETPAEESAREEGWSSGYDEGRSDGYGDGQDDCWCDYTYDDVDNARDEGYQAGYDDAMAAVGDL